MQETHPLPDEIDYEALPDSSSLLAQATAGAFAGILEHTVMYPIDTLKTRMQVVTTQPAISNSLWRSVGYVSKTEGALSLWRGIGSVVVGAGPAHAVYFGTYEYVKKKLVVDESKSNVWEIGVAGSAATIVSEALMNPFDVIKQRMQLHTDDNSAFRVIRDVWKNEGLMSFYYSYPTTIAMTVPFTALNFIFYESSIKLINPTGEHDPLKHCVAGGIAGGVASALTTPLDVIKTFLQTEGVSRGVTKFGQASKLVWREQGLAGFSRGWKPRVVSNVPSTAICWTAYEMAKYYLI